VNSVNKYFMHSGTSPDTETGGTPSVLIIEDEPTYVSFLETSLSRLNCEIVVASDGIAGLSAVTGKKPNVIILDVMLPMRDGFSLLEDMRSNSATADIPVIILSNLDSTREIQRGKTLGANEYLTKYNAKPKDIVELVKKYLAQ